MATFPPATLLGLLALLSQEAFFVLIIIRPLPTVSGVLIR